MKDLDFSERFSNYESITVCWNQETGAGIKTGTTPSWLRGKFLMAPTSDSGYYKNVIYAPASVIFQRKSKTWRGIGREERMGKCWHAEPEPKPETIAGFGSDSSKILKPVSPPTNNFFPTPAFLENSQLRNLRPLTETNNTERKK